jgi:hypothetical protein
MSRSSAKSHAHKKDHRRVANGSKTGRESILIIAAIILAGIPFGLGKYFELNSPGPFDSGSYVYSAAHILNGAKIGVDEKPSALPGTLMVNILGVWIFGFSDIGPKLVQGILQAAALVLMFSAMRRLFCTLAATVAVVVTSVYLSAPLLAKFGNVKEQYMIAFMVLGISSFVLGQLTGRRLWTILCGAFLVWAPLFKPTGLSAPAALGLFVITQSFLKNRTIRQTFTDIGLLMLGAAISIAPLYIWILAAGVQMALPYLFVWEVISKVLPSAGGAQGAAAASYVGTSRSLVPFSEQWPRVMRYYGLLILPITLAVGSVLARLAVWFRARSDKNSPQKADDSARFALLFGLWWILDMAFVWISPRSYEQYYLPLNASAAMLSGYIVTLYRRKLASGPKRTWFIVGIGALLMMLIMSWHIFAGISTSPYSGLGYGGKRRGYLQTYQDISMRRQKDLKAPWEAVGDYIRNHSQPSDKIYVWGWYPGIYVDAQRFSSASRASSTTRLKPAKLKKEVDELLKDFHREMPKFIVDSRKLHIPTNRPPYELWPIAPGGFGGLRESSFLPTEEKWVSNYEIWWTEQLRKAFGDDEAERFIILKPLRDFVMNNYEIVEPQYFIPVSNPVYKLMHRVFGYHVLFELKDRATNLKQ